MDFEDWATGLFLLMSFGKENEEKKQKELEDKTGSQIAAENMIKALTAYLHGNRAE